MARRDILEVKAKYEDQLMSNPVVRGVGVGERDGKPVLLVFVDAQSESSAGGKLASIPRTLEGIPVHIEDIGVVTTQ